MYVCIPISQLFNVLIDTIASYFCSVSQHHSYLYHLHLSGVMERYVWANSSEFITSKY